MSKVIFKNQEHQALFQKQGFLVLPFISDDEVATLDKLFDDLYPEVNEGGFYSGSFSGNFEVKKKASDKIVQVFSRAYERTFINYKPFGGAFLYKVPGENSALAVHQDWTVVDEESQIALNCWVPLCDVTMQNGPLMILPGSQFDNFPVIRSPTLPFFFNGNEDLVLQNVIPFEVKAGTAVILDQSVIHYSPPNRSSKTRKAITAGIKSKDAQMYFHYKVPDKNELEVFAMNDDFLIRFENFYQDIAQRPYLGKSMGFIPYKLPVLSREELRLKINEMTLKGRNITG